MHGLFRAGWCRPLGGKIVCPIDVGLLCPVNNIAVNICICNVGSRTDCYAAHAQMEKSSGSCIDTREKLIIILC